MRTAGVALLLLGAAFAAACGQDEDPRPVTLSVSAPADSAVVRDDEVDVRGRVRPADASVLVRGREASVAGGKFHARVPLEEGANVIDVAASAGGRATAWRAVRVARQVVVEMPDVVGDSRDDAVERLEDLGLRPQVEETDGLLDRFLPAGWGVCETSPEAGTEVLKGARVRLTVSKTC
jgi:hypothetical protein